MNTYSLTFKAAFVGSQTESAYAKVFGATICGGLDDNGKDLTLPENDIPHVQIKSSVTGLKSFLAESLRRKQFIPVCVGEPGAKNEMLSSLRQFGAWIAKDIPNRDTLFAGVLQVRNLCKA